MLRRAVCVAAAAVLLPVTLASSATAADPHTPSWSIETPGWNRSSSPVIADIDGDGHNEVVVGHQDGTLRAYEADGTLKWASAAVPGGGPGCNGQVTASAIDSSPAVADLDGDGRMEVIVGVGSTWRANQNGGVVTFDGPTGAREWSTAIGRDMGNVWADTGAKDGWCEGVYATPSIGDVDGDGHLDVVFAAWDFFIWAVDRNGNPLPGFPFDNDDSVWSSPALFDVDGDGDMEIFVGGDSTPGGGYDHRGGVFRALDWTPGGVVNLWNRNADEVFHSSPAIGDIDHDGRYEAVVATGAVWQAGANGDNRRVFAFHLDDGTNVAGFPVVAGGDVISSPALGDLDGDGRLEVVLGSADRRVYAWNGDGSLLWSVMPDFGHPALRNGRMQGAPVIADLDGDGDQDVAIGSDVGLALLDGHTCASLEAGLIWQYRMAVAWSFEAAPAVGVLGGTRHLVYSGFDTPQNKSRLAAFPLPGSTTIVDDWPMFHHDAGRTGVTTVGACGADSGRVFCDVLPGVYYENAVSWMVDQDITTGVSPVRYGPDRALTRAQMVTFLWREAGSPTGHPAHGFADIPAGAYYEQAVRWAKATGITTGTSSTTFSPDAVVTRGQLVTLLWRGAGNPVTSPASEFVDVVTGRYYANAVGWAKTEGITTGTSSSTFSPEDAVTRGQAAAFLYRTAGSPPV